MASLFTISYRSRSLLPKSGIGLEELVQKSRTKNLRLNVTGILLFDGEHFMQTIEGPHQATSELFRRIMFDDRHTDVIAFGIEFLPERWFPDWSMQQFSPDDTRTIVPDLGDFEFTERRLLGILDAARAFART